MTRISVNDPESGKIILLEINKVDIPTGAGWSVMLPNGKKFLMKKRNGEWETDPDENRISEFVFAVGNEINQMMEAEGQDNLSGKSYKREGSRPRITGNIKYGL